MRFSETPQGRLAKKAIELSSKGFHSEAADLLERALTFKPEDPLVLVYQGRVLRCLGAYDDAEQSLRKAIAVDEGLSYAWNELGMLMESRGAFEKAAFCYERSADISTNAEILTMLANMQLSFDPQRSAENAERALSIDPEWIEARSVLEAAKSEIQRRRSE